MKNVFQNNTIILFLLNVKIYDFVRHVQEFFFMKQLLNSKLKLDYLLDAFSSFFSPNVRCLLVYVY